MQISTDEVKVWVAIAFQVANTVASVGLWLYVRYGDRNKEIDQKISALQKAMDDRADVHDQRLSHVEGQMKGAPTHQDLARLYERVNTIAESTNTMGGELRLMNQNLSALMNKIVEKGLSK